MIDVKIGHYDEQSGTTLDTGDMAIVDGDLALTGSFPLTDEDIARCAAQLAFFGLKTELGDFTLHTNIGNNSSVLYGLPNKPETALLGKTVITRALRAMGITYNVSIESWPEDLNTIAYEVKIFIPNSDQVLTLILRNEIGGI